MVCGGSVSHVQVQLDMFDYKAPGVNPGVVGLGW